MRNDRQFQYGDANTLINRYRQVQQQVSARLPQVLDTLPKAPLEVRAVEPERALTAAAAAYQPSAVRATGRAVHQHPRPAQPQALERAGAVPA